MSTRPGKLQEVSQLELSWQMKKDCVWFIREATFVLIDLEQMGFTRKKAKLKSKKGADLKVKIPAAESMEKTCLELISSWYKTGMNVVPLPFGL